MANNRAKVFIDVESTGNRAFDQVRRGFRDIESASQRLRGTLASLGVGLSVAGFTAFVRSGVQAADELNKLSQRVGVTVESLSALKFAAELSDVSVEQLSTGLRQLAKNAVETQAGTGEAKQAFAALGIEVTNTSGQLKGTETLLLDVAERFASIEDGAGKTALAMKLFGRAGADLIPFLNQGRDGFERLRAEAERLGLVVSGETARAAEQFNDSLRILTSGLQAFKFTVAEAVLPTLNEFVEQLNEGIRAAGGFGKALALFGTLNPFRDVAGNLNEVRGALDELERKRAEILAKGGSTALIDQDIDRARRRVDFLKVLQRQEASELGRGLGLDERRRFGGDGRRLEAAPALPDPDTRRRTAADTRAADAAKLAQFELETLTEAWEAFNDSQKAAAQESEKVSRRLEQLVGGTPIVKTRELLDNVRFLDEAFFSGAINADEWAQAVDKLTGTSAELTDEVKRQSDAARELGLTFTSAFEDAVVEGKKFSEVLKALGDDILRIATRKIITEPLANAAGGFFGDLLGGIFGTAKGGIMPGGFRAFASGGIVRRPTLGLVGEGGQNEAVIPLPDGQNVPVKLQGGGAPSIVINNYAGVQVRAREQDSPDGARLIVDLVRESLLDDLALGGRFRQGIQSTFGAQPVFAR